jgi:hypothetical protein
VKQLSGLEINVVICVAYTDEIALVAHAAAAHDMLRHDTFWFLPYLTHKPSGRMN